MDRNPEVKPDPRRGLPAVDRLAAAVAGRDPALPEWARVEAARRVLAAAREAAGAGEVPPGPEALAERARERAAELARPRPARVVNATGVVLHTNLGRAVLAPGAARAVAEVASRYSDLELDRASGGRGDRGEALAAKLVLLSGAEAALAVNNNAAAVLLVLDSLARGREVIVSRGELVEIGGSFRVPEILERAGVRLVEVGTTNRTHPRDYEAAIGPATALLLKVHRSNFEQRGFVAEVELPALAAIARARDLPLVEDLGSGTLFPLDRHGFPAETRAAARLALGADVVCFSGDKLLGGPQAGIVLGGRRWLEPLARNPLARALRLDKLTLAALDWTLSALLAGRAEREIPTLRQLLAGPELLETRARALAERIAKRLPRDVAVSVEEDRSAVGGGSLPGVELPTRVVCVRGALPRSRAAQAGGTGAAALAALLRAAPVPVLARVRDEALVLDVRTLLDDDDACVEEALAAAFAAAPSPRSD